MERERQTERDVDIGQAERARVGTANRVCIYIQTYMYRYVYICLYIYTYIGPRPGTRASTYGTVYVLLLQYGIAYVPPIGEIG